MQGQSSGDMSRELGRCHLKGQKETNKEDRRLEKAHQGGRKKTRRDAQTDLSLLVVRNPWLYFISP